MKKPRPGAYGGMRTGAGSPWGRGDGPHEVFTMEDTDVSGLWFSREAARFLGPAEPAPPARP